VVSDDEGVVLPDPSLASGPAMQWRPMPESGRVLFVICWNANGLASVASSSAHCTYEFLAGHDIGMLCETQLGCVPRHLLPKHTLHTLLASRDNVSGQGLLLGVTKLLVRARRVSAFVLGI
jgi:hypothetical protein